MVQKNVFSEFQPAKGGGKNCHAYRIHESAAVHGQN